MKHKLLFVTLTPYPDHCGVAHATFHRRGSRSRTRTIWNERHYWRLVRAADHANVPDDPTLGDPFQIDLWPKRETATSTTLDWSEFDDIQETQDAASPRSQ